MNMAVDREDLGNNIRMKKDCEWDYLSSSEIFYVLILHVTKDERYQLRTEEIELTHVIGIPKNPTVENKGAWQPSLNISTILTSIGFLLSEPNPDDGLMCEASKEYEYNKQVFDQKARSMTEKYVRSDASPDYGRRQNLR